jgi:hypothetical protein
MNAFKERWHLKYVDVCNLMYVSKLLEWDQHTIIIIKRKIKIDN